MVKFAVDSDSEQWKCHGCGFNKPVDQMSRCGQCKTYSYCSKVRESPICPNSAEATGLEGSD